MRPCGSKNAGIPLQWSQPPYPPCPKEDLEPLSKPLANRWQEDVIDYGQKPPFIKVLVWLSSFRPFGVRHDFLSATAQTRGINDILIRY